MKHWLTYLAKGALVCVAMCCMQAYAQLQVSFSSDTLYLCEGIPSGLSADVSGGTAPYNYLWNTGDSSVQISIIPLSTGVYYYLLVSDVNGSFSSDSVFVVGLPECVWPGDANGDGLANNEDVLILGLAFGSQGNIRPDAHTNWIGQGAPAWSQTFGTGVNYVHSDTDGDGMVGLTDFQAIGVNYFTPNTGPGNSPSQPMGVPLFVDFPTSSFQPGDTFTAPVILGTADLLADSVYGIAFSIAYSTGLIDSGSVIVSYDTSWLGNIHVDMEAVDKDFYFSGQVDIGISRINQIAVSGYGRIADITVMIDDITGKKEGVEEVAVRIENVSLIDKNGNSIPVNNEGSKFFISLSNDDDLRNEQVDFTLSPNPATGLVRIQTKDNSLRESTLSILDMNGNLIEQSVHRGTNTIEKDLSVLPAGIYLCELKNHLGRRVKKLIIQ